MASRGHPQISSRASVRSPLTLASCLGWTAAGQKVGEVEWFACLLQHVLGDLGFCLPESAWLQGAG